MNNELYHYGILGMKWGVRRYQNPDGSLNAAGKKRYSEYSSLKKEKNHIRELGLKLNADQKSYEKARSKYFFNRNGTYKNALDKAKDTYSKTKIDYEKSKIEYKANKEALRIKDKNIEFKNKSKRRLKLEEKYKSMGLTNEQAQAAANGRIRTEKILGASAAIAVAACAAYVANKKIRERVDTVIKSGETLQRIEMQNTNGKLHDAFYSAKGKHDTARYKSMLGYNRQQQTGEAYIMKLKVKNDIKVASQDKAARIFAGLYNTDSEFREAYGVSEGSRLNGKKQIKEAYERFNRGLVYDSQRSASNRFYETLKLNGYGAIQDINDMKFSGYSAKNPLIIFDNKNSKNVMVESMKKMEDISFKSALKERNKAKIESIIKNNAVFSTATLGTLLGAKTVKTYSSDPSKNMVNTYKELHPNTKLSDKEILKIVKKM